MTRNLNVPPTPAHKFNHTVTIVIACCVRQMQLSSTLPLFLNYYTTINEVLAHSYAHCTHATALIPARYFNSTLKIITNRLIRFFEESLSLTDTTKITFYIRLDNITRCYYGSDQQILYAYNLPNIPHTSAVEVIV